MDHLQKIKKEKEKFKETEGSQYIFQNKLDKACFQHDMTYGDFKDLNGKTTADKALRYKAFDIAKNPKHYRHQCGLVSMVYKFLIKIFCYKLQTNLSVNKFARITQTNYYKFNKRNLIKEKYNHLL